MLRFSARRGLAVVAMALVPLVGCGTTGEHPSYQERIQKLEALIARCGQESTDAGYRRCLRQEEGMISSYVGRLCPHPGGYTFEGQHEPCPSHPIKKLLTIR